MSDDGAPSLRPAFDLDPFQRTAVDAVDAGRSVLVAAPTGSGKTVVAEAAVDRALRLGRRAFYTTPIKALSNQKFADLRRALGPGRVGLLTGDNSIDGEAEVVVMTTEVLRNMIYAGSAGLERLGVVVLDEVHFLQDAYRGPVWEEVIIHLDQAVQLVCLSATVSNADEVGEWLTAVRGPTDVVVEHQRPVELETMYLVGERGGDHLLPVLVDGRPNPDGRHFDGDPRLVRRAGGRRPRYRTPGRLDVVDRLEQEDLLPAIYFLFSRAGCDDALAMCRDAGVRLTSPAERRDIRAIVEDHVIRLHDDDLDVLGYDLWLAALEQGIAAHHAGMVPPFKEAVEACFVRGLVKVVFATETLALGVNMPARSVVIERLTKYTGDGHDFLRPAEFTQLTGRAGRRGIDHRGVALVLWSPFVGFEQVANLASSREFPLRSAFRPTYNMAANLVRRFDRDQVRDVLGMSFAQFQADRSLVGLQRRLTQDRAALERLDEAARCHLGDAEEYARLVDQARRDAGRDRERRRGAIDRSVQGLRPGDLVRAAGEHGRGNVEGAVISISERGKGVVRVDVVGSDGTAIRIDSRDLDTPLHPLGRVELPQPYTPTERAYREAVGRLVSAHGIPAGTRRRTGAAAEEDPVAGHPVHGCPDRQRHLDAMRRRAKVQRGIAAAENRRGAARSSVAHRFDAVVDLLDEWGYLHDWTLTAAGVRLTRIYHECDLLLAEALQTGLLDGLDPPEMAALVSCVCFEERRSDAPVRPPIPTRELRRRCSALGDVARRLRAAERARGLPLTREPDAGFSALAHRWAAGGEFEDMVDDTMSGGDFVRTVKVLIDLLRQLAGAAPVPATRAAAAEAAEALLRGVVAASSDVEVALEPGEGTAAT